MFTINEHRAAFDTFAQAADCAAVHARLRGPALVRYSASGLLVADFRLDPQGNVSIAGACEGVAMVLEWAASR
ncbi:MAG: hypothetical protein ACRYHQ_30900 [Janthinobacterium lividum]